MILSHTEENYLKALFHLTNRNGEQAEVGTNELATFLNVKPASVNDMLKRLREKELVENERYGKIFLTNNGNKIAVQIVRKHRLWETFLHKKLSFSWDEVHEVAEQLEHINSPKLIEQLEKFLDYPEFDPHGDAIPNAQGEIKLQKRTTLSEIEIGRTCKLIAVKDANSDFLQYVLKVGLELGSKIKILNRQEFDGSLEIEIKNNKLTVSQKFADNVFVELTI